MSSVTASGGVPADSIDTRRFEEHDLRTQFGEGMKRASQWLKVRALQVYEVAKNIFLFVVQVGTFWSNSGIFVLGFTATVLFPDKMRAQVDKIIKFYNELNYLQTIGLVVAGFWAWPIISAEASFFFGAYVASQLIEHNAQAED